MLKRFSLYTFCEDGGKHNRVHIHFPYYFIEILNTCILKQVSKLAEDTVRVSDYIFDLIIAELFVEYLYVLRDIVHLYFEYIEQPFILWRKLKGIVSFLHLFL